MPTYKFHCDKCNFMWTVQQKVGENHIANCSKCGKECKNTSFGGTGFQFAGKHMNKQLHGFPDNEHKTNQGADKDAEEMEKAHDQVMKEEAKRLE